MALEVELKFLVRGDDWREAAEPGLRMTQGYLASAEGLSIRVRLAGRHAWLNIKHARKLTVRQEYEYAIPLADGRALLDEVCPGPRVDKTRYRVPHGEHVWEVDVFHADNEGLVIAEIELAREDEPFVRPSWVGAEVSADPRYLNQNLAHTPYRSWPDPVPRP